MTWSALPRWATVTLVAIAARAATFGNPIVHVDEEFYYTVARAMWAGAVPYVDLWDRKPVGLFLLYMPAAALPGGWGILAYQMMALAATIATALIVAHLADRAGWRRGATNGAFAYILWLNLLSGAGGQSPVFYNLPMACAALLVAPDPRIGRERAPGVLAMALVGVALQIKYSVVFEGVFFGVWLLWADWRRSGRVWPTLAYGVALVAVALIPTALAVLYYARAGLLEAFVFANFIAIFARKSNVFGETLRNLLTLALILSPLVAIGLAAWSRRREGGTQLRTFLLVWLLSSVCGVLIFGTWYDHYGLPIVLPASVCAAAWFGAGKWRDRATPAILLTAALAGQIKVGVDRLSRGSPAEFARLAEAVGRGPGCLYVYSGHPMLHTTTGRCRVTPYIFPGMLIRPRESGAVGVDQAIEVRRILAQRPAVIVVAPPYRPENLQIREQVIAEIARHYRERAALPLGWETVRVYERR